MIELAEYLAEGTDISITSNFEQLRAEIKSGSVSKIVVIHGAVNCSTVKKGLYVHAKTCYEALKKEFPHLKVKVMDGWPWDIPSKDFLLLPESLKNLRQAIELM